MDTKEELSVTEAAEFLGVSVASVRRYHNLGIIEGRRMKSGRGRRFMYALDSLKLIKDYGLPHERFTCITPGCENPATHTSGRCSPHHEEFSELRRNTDPQWLRCGYVHVTGEICRRKAISQGFCAGHYITVRYSAEHEHHLPEKSRAERCLMPECKRPQMHGGLCRNHQQMLSYSGGLDEFLKSHLDIQPLASAAHEQFRLWRTLRGETLEEIASRIGVSREWVRKIENKLYARLKNSLEHTRQQGTLSQTELRYLKAVDYPIDRLIFIEEEVENV
jgi:DNA-binding XRE family transcriptional regulator